MSRAVIWHEGLRDWWRAVQQTPQVLRKLAFKRRSLEEELVEAQLQGTLRRALSRLDLLCLGLGQAIAVSIFNLTGSAALQAGPAVIVSYPLAGLCALCAATVMAEFSREFPVAGAGFTYTMLTLGELPAYFVVLNILGYQVLSTAAVARSFSGFLAQLCRQPVDFFAVRAGGLNIDFMAFGLSVVTTLFVSTGVRESSLAITAFVLVHLLMMLVLMIAAWTRAHSSNLQPFFLGGADNMLSSAAILFFAYVGFEASVIGAEEAKDPADLPPATVGNVIIIILVYFLMSLSLVLMVPVAALPPSQVAVFSQSAFPTAFRLVGLGGWSYFVLVTALVGALTSLITLLYSCSRMVMVASRDWVLPPLLARISRRTQTPAVAQLTMGSIIAIIALLTGLASLRRLSVILSLMVYWVVSNALLWRRYWPGLPRMRYSSYGAVEAGVERDPAASGHLARLTARLSPASRKALVVSHLVAINGTSVALSAVFQTVTLATALPTPGSTASPPFSRWLAVVLLLAGWAGVTLSMQVWCPLEYEPPAWRIPWPLMPWLPSASLLLILFFLANIPGGEFIRFAVWVGILAVFYLLFSLPMSYLHHYARDWKNVEELNVIELTLRDGQWVPARKHSLLSPQVSAMSLPPRTASTSLPTGTPPTPRTPRTPHIPGSLRMPSALRQPSTFAAVGTPRTPTVHVPSGMRRVSFDPSCIRGGSDDNASTPGSSSGSPRQHGSPRLPPVPDTQEEAGGEPPQQQGD